MAGHSKFANIKHRKGAQDQKRAKLFTKIIREIVTAAKVGGIDPDGNPRLRGAISAARAVNLPKDRIEAALSKAEGNGEGDNYEEMRYEGYAPGGIAIIVEALTDNRNRTASEVRSSFTKFGGNLGENGSVAFMFNKIGYVGYSLDIDSGDKVFEASIEVGANDYAKEDSRHCIYCEITDFNDVRDKLIKIFGDPEEAKIIWRPLNTIEVNDLEQAEKLVKMLDMLEDSDDVQSVYGNYSFSEEILAKLEK